MNKQVSFDYDGTLSVPEVQEYCKELIERGYEIFITTYRYCDMLKHLWQSNPNNDDLYKVCDELGIPRTNIVFTNFNDKGKYLEDSRVLFHLDDDFEQTADINGKVPGLGIIYRSGCRWKENCEDKLKN